MHYGDGLEMKRYTRCAAVETDRKFPRARELGSTYVPLLQRRKDTHVTSQTRVTLINWKRSALPYNVEMQRARCDDAGVTWSSSLSSGDDHGRGMRVCAHKILICARIEAINRKRASQRTTLVFSPRPDEPTRTDQPWNAIARPYEPTAQIINPKTLSS